MIAAEKEPDRNFGSLRRDPMQYWVLYRRAAYRWQLDTR